MSSIRIKKEKHWASGTHEDDILACHRPINENALIGNCHHEHDPAVEEELRQMKERHQRTAQRDADLRRIRENTDVVSRVLAVLETMHFKNMTALNPRNYPLVEQIARQI